LAYPEESQLSVEIRALSQVIFNGNHTPTNTEGPTGITIPTDPAVFKTAWWLGSTTDNNMGTVAYPTMDKIAPGMTPDGWADEGWFRLLQVCPSLYVLCFLCRNPSRGTVHV
jgi:hypothetical protein